MTQKALLVRLAAACFSTLCYNADGTCILAGVCEEVGEKKKSLYLAYLRDVRVLVPLTLCYNADGTCILAGLQLTLSGLYIVSCTASLRACVAYVLK
jgi:hypothetical protein